MHSAGLTLRRYIPRHWSPFFEQFEGNAPPVEIKAQVRELLFAGLGDPSRKIRFSCAYTTAELAHSDWPDEYPQLMDLLLGALNGGSPEQVDGALRVLTDFVKADLTEDQLLPTAQQMLPQLLTILKSPEVCLSSLCGPNDEGGCTALLRRGESQSGRRLPPICPYASYSARAVPRSRVDSGVDHSARMARNALPSTFNQSSSRGRQ